MSKHGIENKLHISGLAKELQMDLKPSYKKMHIIHCVLVNTAHLLAGKFNQPYFVLKHVSKFFNHTSNTGYYSCALIQYSLALHSK